MMMKKVYLKKNGPESGYVCRTPEALAVVLKVLAGQDYVIEDTDRVNLNTTQEQ